MLIDRTCRRSANKFRSRGKATRIRRQRTPPSRHNVEILCARSYRSATLCRLLAHQPCARDLDGQECVTRTPSFCFFSAVSVKLFGCFLSQSWKVLTFLHLIYLCALLSVTISTAGERIKFSSDAENGSVEITHKPMSITYLKVRCPGGVFLSALSVLFGSKIRFLTQISPGRGTAAGTHKI